MRQAQAGVRAAERGGRKAREEKISWREDSKKVRKREKENRRGRE